jgi:hypothetical protein
MLLPQCGVIGPPIAPEDVGVAPIIERQKKREAERLYGQMQPAPLSGGYEAGASDTEPMMEPAEALPVPPLKQMGTR